LPQSGQEKNFFRKLLALKLCCTFVLLLASCGVIATGVDQSANLLDAEEANQVIVANWVFLVSG
jgi:hypothetical protein